MTDLLELRSLHAPQTYTELFILVFVLGAVFVVMRQLNGSGFASIMFIIALAAFIVDAHIFIPLAFLVAGLLTSNRSFDQRPRRQAVRFALDFSIVFAGFMLYELGRVYSEGSYETALYNAKTVVGIQHSLGLPDEASVQSLILQYRHITEIFNYTYSFLFLTLVTGVLVWLYLNNDREYRMYRNALAMSAFFTVLISWLYPVAPPRLYPASSLVDTHIQMGREHGFVNEFAAMPSLHVGWTVLVGVFLFRAIRGWKGLILGIAPAAIISLTVVVTGNHFWLDGMAGALLCLVAFGLVLSMNTAFPDRLRVPRSVVRSQKRIGSSVQTAAATALGSCGDTCRAIIVLTMMFSYLLIGQIVAPGFTDHWGYLTAQVGATLAIVVTVEYVFRDDGGLFSWQTLLAICAATALDLFGTSEDLYANFAAYDKIVHFVGTACFTAVVLDVLGKLSSRGKVSWERSSLIVVGVLLGIFAGVAWEIYEYVGDHVFNSARTGGFWDTSYDLIFDTLGAIAIGIVFLFPRWFSWGILGNYRWHEFGSRADQHDPSASESYLTSPKSDSLSE